MEQRDTWLWHFFFPKWEGLHEYYIKLVILVSHCSVQILHWWTGYHAQTRVCLSMQLHIHTNHCTQMESLKKWSQKYLSQSLWS